VSVYRSTREDVLAFVAGDLPQKDPENVALFQQAALNELHVMANELPNYPAKGT
jgi:hypothetical protein